MPQLLLTLDSLQIHSEIFQSDISKSVSYHATAVYDANGLKVSVPLPLSAIAEIETILDAVAFVALRDKFNLTAEATNV